MASVAIARERSRQQYETRFAPDEGSAAVQIQSDARRLLAWARSERPGLKVCAISNVHEVYRDAVLPRLGLEAYLDFGLYSRVECVAKPDRAIFLRAAARGTNIRFDRGLGLSSFSCPPLAIEALTPTFTCIRTRTHVRT